MALKRYLPALGVAVLLASPARAEWMSGEQLQEACSAKAPVDRAMCLSYVIGVLDGLRSAERPVKVPEDVSAGQARDVVAAYLAGHDGALALQGREVVKAAIVDAWPEIQPKAEPPPKRKAPAELVRKTRRRG